MVALAHSHPPTQALLNRVKDEIADLKDFMGDGGTLTNRKNADEVTILTAMTVGNIKGLEFILNLKGDDDE